VDFIPGRARLLFGLEAKPRERSGGRTTANAQQ
jgi:hypothetical protein